MATKAIVGEKVGMTQVWDDDNRVVPVTVLRSARAGSCRSRPTSATATPPLQVTFGTKKARKLTKPEAGQFEKAGVDPGPRSSSCASTTSSGYSVGQEIKADLLAEGEQVDVTAVSKGKGFAGAMKRHGFGGLGASHGTHRMHRAPGVHRRLRHARPGCSRARAWPAAWAAEKVTTLNLDRRRRPTPSATCCSSRARCPAPRAASSSSATP